MRRFSSLFFLSLVLSLFNFNQTYANTSTISFESIPKAELHLHLGGAYPLDFLLSHANEQQSQELMDNLHLISQGVTYQSVFHVFRIIGQIVNTEEKVEDGTYALCRNLQADGVSYAEIRTGLKDMGNGLESYLQAVLNGMEKARFCNFESALILSVQRSSSAEVVKQTIDLALQYRSRGIVGIDLSGNSTLGNVAEILPELLRAKENGLQLSIHMGEEPGEQDQELIVNFLKPDRIGHGVHLCENVRNWMLENRVPLEVCLTSAFLVQMVDHYAEHPGLAYGLRGHPIIICTDDPLLFQTSLSQEFERLQSLQLFSPAELLAIVQAGFQHAFKNNSNALLSKGLLHH